MRYHWLSVAVLGTSLAQSALADDYSDHMRKGSEAAEAGDDPTAERAFRAAFEAATDRRPADQGKAALKRALALGRLQKTGEMIAEYETVIRLAERDPRAPKMDKDEACNDLGS